MNATKIIMRDSPEAAQPHTMTGWKSSDGFFYKDEDTARYAGCTHVACSSCGAPCVKHYTHCDACRNAREIERYNALKKEPWDGVGMLYSDARDVYYTDISDAEDALEEGETLADLRLLICEPNYVRELDSDYCCDEVAEDGEPPDAVLEAMDAFNKAVKGIVLSWSPSETAMLIDPTPNPQQGE